MTAMQESSLTVLQHGRSGRPGPRAGLFQQRDTWGPESVRLDPSRSTGLFLDRLIAVPEWQTLPPQKAAHEVQHNGDARDYLKWIPLSKSLAAALTRHNPVQVQCSGDDTVAAAGAAPTAGARTALHSGCVNARQARTAGDAGDAHGPTHSVAAAAGADRTSEASIASGLVLYAWAQAGITPAAPRIGGPEGRYPGAARDGQAGRSGVPVEPARWHTTTWR